jgi:hypothetical protein
MAGLVRMAGLPGMAGLAGVSRMAGEVRIAGGPCACLPTNLRKGVLSDVCVSTRIFGRKRTFDKMATTQNRL